MLRHFKHLVCLVFLVCFSMHTHAALFLDSNALYYSDGLSTTTASSSSNIFFDGYAGFSVDKKSRFQLGWSYGLQKLTTSGSSTASYATTQTGPKFVFYIDKRREWSLSGTYNIISNATSTIDGGTEETWRGRSFKFDLGYTLWLSDYFGLGLRVNYLLAQYSEMLVGGTTYSTITYSRTNIYPSLYFGISF